MEKKEDGEERVDVWREDRNQRELMRRLFILAAAEGLRSIYHISTS